MKMQLEYKIITVAPGHVDRDPKIPLAPAPGGKFNFEKGKDQVSFSAVDPTAAILYTPTSPFNGGPGSGEPQANVPFLVGNGTKGPFKTNVAGNHHFDCGNLVGAVFTQYAGTGDDTPVEP